MDPDEPLSDEITFLRMKMEDSEDVALFEAYSFEKRGKMDIGIQEQWNIDDYISRFAMELAGEDPVCFGFLAKKKEGEGGGGGERGGALCGFLTADIIPYEGVWVRKVIVEGPQEGKIIQKLFDMAIDHWSFKYRTNILRMKISPSKKSIITDLEKKGFKVESEDDLLVLSLELSNYLNNRPTIMTKELDESLNQRFAELAAKQRCQQQVWLPDVEGSGELLSPEQASNLQFLGIQVVVERSKQTKRLYLDEEYAIAGGSWQSAPNNAAILMPKDVLDSLRAVASSFPSPSSSSSSSSLLGENEELSLPNMDKNFITSLEMLGIEG